MNDCVLIVDDDQTVVNAIYRSLSLHFNLLTALSGPEALEILRNVSSVSVVISDFRMQGMDGIQLLTTAKRLYPNIYSILLTGNQDNATKDLSDQSKVVDCLLIKPVKNADLVAAISAARAIAPACVLPSSELPVGANADA